MDTFTWQTLSKAMAIEAITHDLIDIFVPAADARLRAHEALTARNQEALTVEYRMGQALHALETLGYQLIKDDFR